MQSTDLWAVFYFHHGILLSDEDTTAERNGKLLRLFVLSLLLSGGIGLTSWYMMSMSLIQNQAIFLDTDGLESPNLQASITNDALAELVKVRPDGHPSPLTGSYGGSLEVLSRIAPQQELFEETNLRLHTQQESRVSNHSRPLLDDAADVPFWLKLETTHHELSDKVASYVAGFASIYAGCRREDCLQAWLVKGIYLPGPGILTLFTAGASPLVKLAAANEEDANVTVLSGGWHPPPQALADCQLRMQFRVATSVDGTPVQQLPFGTVESSNCGWALAATTADLLPFEPVKLLSFKEERLDLVCACLGFVVGVIQLWALMLESRRNWAIRGETAYRICVTGVLAQGVWKLLIVIYLLEAMLWYWGRPVAPVLCVVAALNSCWAAYSLYCHLCSRNVLAAEYLAVTGGSISDPALWIWATAALALPFGWGCWTDTMRSMSWPLAVLSSSDLLFEIMANVCLDIAACISPGYLLTTSVTGLYYPLFFYFFPRDPIPEHAVTAWYVPLGMLLWVLCQVWTVCRQGVDLPATNGSPEYDYKQRLVFEYVDEGKGRWYRKLVGAANLMEDGSLIFQKREIRCCDSVSWLFLWPILLLVELARMLAWDIKHTLRHLGRLKGCTWMYCGRMRVRGNATTAAWAVRSGRGVTFYEGPCPALPCPSPSESSAEEYICPICYYGVVVPHLNLQQLGTDGEEQSTAKEERLMEYMVTPCNHVYHAHCLKRCVLLSGKCPSCRQKLPRTTGMELSPRAPDPFEPQWRPWL